MLKPILIALDKGEKMYVNGAVIRATQRCRFEIMNEATFLLQQHVMQVEQATTPLRQLYFVLQTAIMDPRSSESLKQILGQQIAALLNTFREPAILRSLERIRSLVAADRVFDALKATRALFPQEDSIMKPSQPAAKIAEGASHQEANP